MDKIAKQAETLADIAALMVSNRAQRETDIEDAHGFADDLLIRALQIIGWEHPRCQEIIDLYETVPKWYA